VKEIESPETRRLTTDPGGRKAKKGVVRVRKQSKSVKRHGVNDRLPGLRCRGNCRPKRRFQQKGGRGGPGDSKEEGRDWGRPC